MSFNVTVSYVTIPCSRCGIVFGVPEQWYEERLKDGRLFRCPNGHRLGYTPSDNDEPTPAEIELRRLHIRTLHDQEQAEARAAEGKPLADAPIADFDALHCLACEKRYKNPGSFRRHMERTHKVDPVTLKPMQP